MRIFKRLFLTIILVIFIGEMGMAQSNPAPWNLTSSGNYSLTAWPSASGAGLYPPSSIWHRTSTLHPPLSAPTTGDYTLAYNLASGARITGQGLNGFDFINEVSAANDHNLGAFVVALNTTGRTNITVTWNARGVAVGAKYNVRLQYRVTTQSPWTGVLVGVVPVEFAGTGGVTGTTSFNTNVSTATANVIDDRPNIQLRWKYYYADVVGGSPSSIRLDEINVLSAPLSGVSTSTDLILGSPFCVTPTLGANVTIPFKYELSSAFAGATFTAQLSNTTGFFGAPINIGSATSNGTGFQNIAATIPAGTPYGTGYRIRVISSSPTASFTTDNYIDLTIKLSPLDVTSPVSICYTDSSIINWVFPTTSCYSEVMVVANPNSPVSVTPSGNGSAYTANSVYGSGTPFGTGFVIYKGTGTSINTTGLTTGTQYYFKIWVRYGSEWTLGQEVSCVPDFATKVLVNGYLNSSAPVDEWTELIVTGDNLDMRDYKIRDNNATQNGWQTEFKFNIDPFWQHVRRGTVIMIYHRINSHTIDNDQQDGYIQLDATDVSYFNGGSPTTLDLATPGDIVEVTDPSYNHIHGMGHLASPGASWVLMPSPKVNYAGGTSSGDAVYACPGGSMADYNGPSGFGQVAISSVTTTFGLPNACAGTTNEDFWRFLRQPYMSPQTSFFSSITPGMPGSVSFSWLPAIDPYPSDFNSGYIVLRNTINSFLSPPADGTTYIVGNMIGGATVVGSLMGSATTNFTDNTVFDGNTYYYRVYAYRFNNDNINGNSYNIARGRAYNETNFVQVNWPSTSPLPVNLLYFKGDPKVEKIHLTWTTSSEKDNDYFLIEKSLNGKDFTFLGKVKGVGNSTSIQNYFLDDLNPSSQANYYALTQVDFDGKRSQKKIIAVKYKSTKAITVTAYPNPFLGDVLVDCSSDGSGTVEIKLFDCLGKLVMMETRELQDGANHFQLSTSKLESGTYFLEMKNENGGIYHSRIMKK